ncbi:MAG: NYN domain-containing protein [Gemmatimonadetes bacterium]|nr:NYN domain-containing protein [Gemmatimonadota bacterium]
MTRTHVYIDGFNLYYGCLKATPFRWLDVAALSRRMLPGHQVRRIKYFTAHVSPRASDPQQPLRQLAYLRALRTLPTVEIHLGHYLSHRASMLLAVPPVNGPRFATVIKTEEKGSDVNLASHLICDAYEDEFDVGVLVTNDSDLLTPVQIVTKRLGKKVGILNPRKHPARVLRDSATFVKRIRPGPLRDSQLPAELRDAQGVIRKPAGW